MPGACARYTSKATKYTYYVNTSATDFYSAQQLCNDNGGHLTSYLSDQEQKWVACSAASGTVLHALVLHA